MKRTKSSTTDTFLYLKVQLAMSIINTDSEAFEQAKVEIKQNFQFDLDWITSLNIVDIKEALGSNARHLMVSALQVAILDNNYNTTR